MHINRVFLTLGRPHEILKELGRAEPLTFGRRKLQTVFLLPIWKYICINRTVIENSYLLLVRIKLRIVIGNQRNDNKALAFFYTIISKK